MTTTMSIEGKENEIFYDGLSDMYIESITPNIIEKNDLKFENLLISIKGIWDSDSISHGVLERIDLDDGLLLPNTKKIVDILHLNERSGTSAYFAIDLKEFSVGRYKFLCHYVLLCRGYAYYLLANTKKPFSYVLSWLPRIVVASIIVSILSAYINDSFNIFTITQLMPYILAPHLIAFFCAMLLSYFNVTHYIAEKVVLEDKKLPGWHM